MKIEPLIRNKIDILLKLRDNWYMRTPETLVLLELINLPAALPKPL